MVAAFVSLVQFPVKSSGYLPANGKRTLLLSVHVRKVMAHYMQITLEHYPRKAKYVLFKLFKHLHQKDYSTPSRVPPRANIPVRAAIKKALVKYISL